MTSAHKAPAGITSWPYTRAELESAVVYSYFSLGFRDATQFRQRGAKGRGPRPRLPHLKPSAVLSAWIAGRKLAYTDNYTTVELAWEGFVNFLQFPNLKPKTL